MPAKKMAIFVCDTAEQVVAAHAYLAEIGYSNASISEESVTDFSYDAKKYSKGLADGASKKFVVIGRQ